MIDFILAIQDNLEIVRQHEVVHGWVFAVIGAITALYGAFSSYQQQQAAADAKEQEAMNREAQAKMEEQKAKQERLNREAEADKERQQAKRRRAVMEAGYAKSGVMLDGTPAEFLEEQAATDEIDVQRAGQVSEARALGYEVNSKSLMNSAGFAKNEAGAYRSGATSSLIGGVGGAVAGGIEGYKKDYGKYPSWMSGDR